jgi:NADPH2 dehydrogenase
MGRGGSDQILAAAGFSLLSSVAEPIAPGYPVPKAMTEEDIQQTLQDYVKSARNAIEAGFDGVEIHGANGYLLDQFLQDVCNKRTDRWGGSIENRARFHLEVTRAIINAIGADRTAIRLSPYSTYQGMLMDNPVPTYKYLLDQLKPLGLAYLHLIEARIAGDSDQPLGSEHSVGWMIHQWDNVSPVLLAGGFTAESAKEAVDVQFKDHNVAIVFGRHFVSNPDLVYRIKRGMPFDKYDRAYFYAPAGAKGYIDYPYSQQFLSQPAAQ